MCLNLTTSVGGFSFFKRWSSGGFEPENADQLVKNLVKLDSDKYLYQKLSQNYLTGAKKYDRTILAHKMLKILMGVTMENRGRQ